MTVTITVAELSKQSLEPALFDIPSGYQQVNSLAELHGMSQVSPQAAGATGTAPIPSPANGAVNDNRAYGTQVAKAYGPMGQQVISQYAGANRVSPMGLMPNMAGMPGMQGNQPASVSVAAPQALGPKAPGKIRIGVAPPDAQLGQGNNAGADYSTPIRNALVLLMNGPAVEIAALDSHIPMQLQAEAEQKQCDYIGCAT